MSQKNGPIPVTRRRDVRATVFFGRLRADGGLIELGVGLLGASIGYLNARAKAFLLRLAAQKALCQVRIEENTRPK